MFSILSWPLSPAPKLYSPPTAAKSLPNIGAKDLLDKVYRKITRSSTEAIVTLTIHMDPININLGGAPLTPSIHPSIDPVSTGLVGDPSEGEGEDTLTASVWARHGGAGGHRGRGGADGGGADLLS